MHRASRDGCYIAAARRAAIGLLGTYGVPESSHAPPVKRTRWIHTPKRLRSGHPKQTTDTRFVAFNGCRHCSSSSADSTDLSMKIAHRRPMPHVNGGRCPYGVPCSCSSRQSRFADAAECSRSTSRKPVLPATLPQSKAGCKLCGIHAGALRR